MISLRDVVTGFGNRDPLAEVWRRSLRGGGGGSAVITGVPPLRYIGNGKPLTDYRIAGNALQDGTPSPEAPVDATGCGVRTGNLFDFEQLKNAPSGTIGNTTSSHVLTLRLKANTYYTMASNGTGSTNSTPADLYRSIYFNAMTAGSSINKSNPVTLLTDSTGVVRISFFSDRTNAQQYLNGEAQLWINEGSTPLPYEPYGYKLPPTVNGTEYPIYLGQVETTRRIKKLVLTGEEAWQLWNGNYYSSVIDRKGAISTILCTHFINSSARGISYNVQSTSELKIASVAVPFVSSVNGLKAWLAAQYANGTPVTVWYVLTEPETAIVNEPLMKIGDYADTIRFAQAGVSIPTINGENVLDVPTTVPPSEITIKGGISSV